MPRALLLWLVDGTDHGTNAERNVIVLRVSPQQQAGPLSAAASPAVQEPVHDARMIKHDVVHVTVGLEGQNELLHQTQSSACSADLSAEGDGTGLALGADARGPGGMVQAAAADLAAEVLQVEELAAVHAAGQLPQVAVEGEVLDGGVEGGQVARVPGVQGGTVHALCLSSVVAPSTGRG